MVMKGPTYIKVDEYEGIVDIIHLTREKIKRARLLLEKINQLKRQEDDALDNWRRELEEVEDRINDINQTLFKP